MIRQRKLLLWLSWAGLTLLGLIAALGTGGLLARQAEQRRIGELQTASLRPQQFVVNWLELRRQLLRGLVLQSRGQGWAEAAAFEADLRAISQDSDGEIALAVALARVDEQGVVQLQAQHGVDREAWFQLLRLGVPTQRRELLLTPLPDGRVPLLRPAGRDQWVWLLLDLPDTLRQLHSIDWPAGLDLQLSLRDLDGRSHPVWRSARLGPTRLHFESEEPGVAGHWRFEWSVGGTGADLRLPWVIAGLGALTVLGLSALAMRLLLQTRRLRELNVSLAEANRELQTGLAERLSALQSLADAQLQQVLKLADQTKLDELQRLRGEAVAVPARRRFELNALLQNLLQELGPQLRSLACLLEFQPQGELWLDSHPETLAEVLRLLLRQALVQRLGQRLGAELRLGYRASGATGAQIWIEDNGASLDAAQRRALFEPWLADAPADARALALVQAELQLRLGGELHLEPRSGQGNRLVLDLPLQAPE